jgi:DNA end-binding protein Ku
MAEQLIDSLTRSFDPSAYRDEYREELLAMIERKAAGEEVVAAPEGEEREATKAPDLMAALEESIAAVKGDGKPKKSKPKATAKKRKPAAKKTAAPKRAGSGAKSKSSK